MVFTMNDLIFLFGLFLAFELFESNWQKSDTLYGVIDNNYKIYKKSIYLFIVMNPTFFYAIYVAMKLNNFGFMMSSIIVLKFLDISFRLSIMNKIENNQSIKHILPIDIKMDGIMQYLNIILYLPIFGYVLYTIGQ